VPPKDFSGKNVIFFAESLAKRAIMLYNKVKQCFFEGIFQAVAGAPFSLQQTQE
jgi:hypothetical protein